MSSSPRISIVTPSLNQGQFLEENIQSIISQGYRNVEHIVIDGASSDETLKVLKQHDKDVTWVSEKDKGQTHAINKGMKMAKGDILMYLNADDYLLPGALEKIVQEYSGGNEWIVGDYTIVDEKGRQIERWTRWYKRLVRLFHSKLTLSLINYIPQPATAWSRKLWEKIGKFDESFRYDMDYDYWLRLTRIAKPHFINTPLSAFRVHSGSKSYNEFKDFIDEEIKVLRKNGSSSLVQGLHRLHSMITLATYKITR